MKRILCLICVLLFSVSLAGCGKAEAKPKSSEILGIDWSVTPEQARSALELPEGSLQGGVLTVENTEFFGAAVQTGEFRFLEDSMGQLRLSSIRLVYPDDTDMSVVKQALEQAYGPGLESSEEYDLSQKALRTISATDNLAIWHSSQNMASLSADAEFPLREDWSYYLEAMQKLDGDADGALMDFYRQSPVVRLFWTNDGQLPYLAKADQPKNAVYFDASLLALMR